GAGSGEGARSEGCQGSGEGRQAGEGEGSRQECEEARACEEAGREEGSREEAGREETGRQEGSREEAGRKEARTEEEEKVTAQLGRRASGDGDSIAVCRFGSTGCPLTNGDADPIAVWRFGSTGCPLTNGDADPIAVWRFGGAGIRAGITQRGRGREGRRGRGFRPKLVYCQFASCPPLRALRPLLLCVSYAATSLALRTQHLGRT